MSGLFIGNDCRPYNLGDLFNSFYSSIKNADPNFSLTQLEDRDFQKDGWYACRWSGDDGAEATSLQGRRYIDSNAYFLRITKTTSSTGTDYTATLYTLGGEILAQSKGNGCNAPQFYQETAGQTTLLKSAIASVIGPVVIGAGGGILIL